MAATPGRYDKKYVSAIGMLDYHEYRKYFMMPDPNMADLSLLLMELGKIKSFKPDVEKTNAYRYYNYSLPQVMETINTTGATITGSGSNTLTVVMASAALSGFIRENYQVRIGTKTAVVTNVSRTNSVATMTIKSADGSNLSLTAGTQIPVVGSAFGEGSEGQTSIRQDLGTKENYIQIFKESNTVTDVVNTSRIEVEGPNGEMTYTYISDMLMYGRHFAQMSAAIIASQITPQGFNSQSPSLVDKEGNTIQTTRGIDQYATSFGIAVNASNSGVFDKALMYAIEDAWTAAKIPPQEMYGFVSTKSRRPIAEYAKNLTGSGGLTAARLDVAGHEIDLMVNKLVTPGGYGLNVIPLSILNDPDTVGAIPDIANSGYFIPMGNAPTDRGAVAPYLGIRYIEQPPVHDNGELKPVAQAANLKIRETITGQFAPVPTGTRAEHRTDLYSAIGVDATVPEHFTKVTFY